MRLPRGSNLSALKVKRVTRTFLVTRFLLEPWDRALGIKDQFERKVS